MLQLADFLDLYQIWLLVLNVLGHFYIRNKDGHYVTTGDKAHLPSLIPVSMTSCRFQRPPLFHWYGDYLLKEDGRYLGLEGNTHS